VGLKSHHPRPTTFAGWTKPAQGLSKEGRGKIAIPITIISWIEIADLVNDQNKN